MLCQDTFTGSHLFGIVRMYFMTTRHFASHLLSATAHPAHQSNLASVSATGQTPFTLTDEEIWRDTARLAEAEVLVKLIHFKSSYYKQLAERITAASGALSDAKVKAALDSVSARLTAIVDDSAEARGYSASMPQASASYEKLCQTHPSLVEIARQVPKEQPRWLLGNAANTVEMMHSNNHQLISPALTLDPLATVRNCSPDVSLYESWAWNELIASARTPDRRARRSDADIYSAQHPHVKAAFDIVMRCAEDLNKELGKSDNDAM